MTLRTYDVRRLMPINSASIMEQNPISNKTKQGKANHQERKKGKMDILFAERPVNADISQYTNEIYLIDINGNK